jgi:lysozyme
MTKTLIDQLTLHEGSRNFVYKDTTGNWTIGVGRNISRGGMGLSDEEIAYLLKNDIKRIDKELDKTFPFYSKLDSVRRDALINICFNVGLPRLKKFQFALRALELGDYSESSVEFLDSIWADQVGQRAKDVAHMIETGEYP